MKVNDPNLSPAGASGLGSAGIAGTKGASAPQRVNTGSGTPGSAAGAAPADDVHLSELVRSLRSLAADSPERQTKIESLARAYASGSYQVDSHATAAAIIGDATKR
jgi:flagellar biosynthesis anti-sigma factor FlgM